MESLHCSIMPSRVWYFIGLIVIYASFVCSKTLRVGGFIAMSHAVSGWNSKGIQAALEMALEDVNRDPDILPEYNLTVEWKDERCGTGYSIKGLFELLTKKQPLIAILGPGCSVETQKLAFVPPFWNLIQIGFSSSDPRLSDRVLYTNYYRINPSENNFNRVVKSLLHEFEWQKLWILKEASGIFLDIVENLNHTFNHTIGIESSRSFVKAKFIAKQIRYFKNKNARILYLLMYVSNTRKVLCEAYKQGFYGNEIQWILMGWFQDGWWNIRDTNCTGEEIKTVMGNYFALTDMTLREDTETTFGLKPNAFKREYLSREKTSPDLVFGAFGYDAVWVLAVALHKTDEQLRIRNNETLSDFNYARKDIADLIKEQVSNINITGLSGNIMLDAHRNRATDVWVLQFQGTAMVRIGEFQRNAININHTKVKWKGGKIPTDRTPSITVVLKTQRRRFYVSTAMALLGIIMALAFLWFNVQHRNNQYIKRSSPPLNNIIIIGTVFCYLFVILLGLDTFGVNKDILCLVRFMLASIGFSLAFGTMFVKTWRVYRIFTNSKLEKTIAYLSNKCLMMSVGFMVLFDIIYILVWNKVQKISCVRYFTGPLMIKNVQKNFFTYICSPNFQNYNNWFVGLFAYKALLLTFAMVLAWKTRKVQLPGLNDSKVISLCVYNVVIFALVLVPLQALQPPWLIDTKGGITSFLMIFCPSLVLLVIFVPKIYRLRCSSKRKVNTAAVSVAVIQKHVGRIHNCPSCSCHEACKDITDTSPRVASYLS